MRRPSKPRRLAVRGAVLAAPLSLSLALPAAAFADDTPGHASPLGVVNSLLIFLVLPVGVFLVVGLLTLRPWAANSSQRYRPGRDWSAEPSWTGVQPAPPALPDAASSGEDGRVMLPHTEGGHHAPVMAGTPHQEHASSQADHDAAEAGHDAEGETPPTGPHPPTETGGARGSW
ncbi:MAG: hypothetical protein ACRDTP_06685 [Mycobacteriales bacterium]